MTADTIFDEQPLSVAIIGSGPAGFYAAEHLLKTGTPVTIDIFDRLPTPFGLVRGGVAPDHPKIKSVTRVYERIAANPLCRFMGNVNYGTDLTLTDLERHYHAVIFCSGAPADRSLDIPGEQLVGSHAATAFVGWYNGHPDFRDEQFDLSVESAVVVGVGNVAMDVARILCRTPTELAATDIASHALEALSQNRIRNVYVLGRRGPVQAAFTTPEIKELGELEAADLVVNPEDLELDPVSREILEHSEDRTPQKNLEVLRGLADRPPRERPRRIVLKFNSSPLAIDGKGRVEKLTVVKNRLESDGRGGVRAVPTNHTETIPAGLVFRSVGYRGMALPWLPFDERTATLPHDAGRLKKPDGSPWPGVYTAGWIKRGPSGVIGTNKPCAVETVETLLSDWKVGSLTRSVLPPRDSIVELLTRRGVQLVTWEEWQRIDRAEQAAGSIVGRPRIKLTRISELVAAARST